MGRSCEWVGGRVGGCARARVGGVGGKEVQGWSPGCRDGPALVLPYCVHLRFMAVHVMHVPPPVPPQVTVLKLEDIKSGDDLYCRVEVRPGRSQQTRTVPHNPVVEFNEDFALIVSQHHES